MNMLHKTGDPVWFTENTKVANLALHKQHRADMSQFVDTDTWPDIAGRKT